MKGANMGSLHAGDQCALRDTVGRGRILAMCEEIRRGCQRLDTDTMRAKLQHGFAEAAAGGPTESVAEKPAAAGCRRDGSMPLLQVPRGRKPLSLWD